MTFNLENIVSETIEERRLLADKSHVLLMVSGGCDSVAMAYIFSKLYGADKNLAIMHLNHNLRGDDSKSDMDFVCGLAKHLGIKLFSYSEDIAAIADSDNKNVEACAREVRYKLANDSLKKWAESKNADLNNFAIVTAHTLNDRIENFYMRSIVGTGPGGFYSIAYKRDNIIRPLLDVQKTDLQSYVSTLEKAFEDSSGLRWHEDATNADTSRFRAYVRAKIVPAARQYNQNFHKNLANTMNLISDENDFLDSLAQEVYEKVVEQNDTQYKVSPEISNYDLVLQRRVAYSVLRHILPDGERINNTSVESLICAFTTHNYTDNIQGNLIIHSNNRGTTITSADNYRKSRNRIR